MPHNQKKIWEKTFRERPLVLKTSEFAKDCIRYFPKKAKILELGCGLSKDCIFFAKKGHRITALDFSKEAIKRAKETVKCSVVKNIRFFNQDINKKLKFEKDSFDVVYARLSLHYFSIILLTKLQREFLMRWF